MITINDYNLNNVFLVREAALYHKEDTDLYLFHSVSLIIIGVHAELGMRTLLPTIQSAAFSINARPLGARDRRAPRLSIPRV